VAQEPGDAHVRARLDEATQGMSGLYFQQLQCGKDLCLTSTAGDAMQQQASPLQETSVHVLVSEHECMVIESTLFPLPL
jgi:hypothetical protein